MSEPREFRSELGMIYTLSNDGELTAVNPHGVEVTVPDPVARYVKKTHFGIAEDDAASAASTPKKLRLEDLTVETQDRFNKAQDIVAGVVKGVSQLELRRARRYIKVVRSVIKGDT